MVKQKYLFPIFALVMANAFWGANTFLIKIGLETIPVPIFIAIRFMAASAIILPFALRFWKPLKRKDLFLLLTSSIFYISLSVLALNIGLTKTTASNASVIWLLMPIILFLFSVSFLKEKISLKTFIGIMVALVGSLLIIGKPWYGSGDMLTGNLLVVTSVFCNAISTVLCKSLTKGISSYQVTFMNFFPGALPIVIYALTQLGSWQVEATTSRSIVALITSTLLVVAANLLFFYALKWKTLQSIGVYQYIDPLTTVLGAWVFLSERPTPLFFVGAGLIVVGVYVVEMRSRMMSRRS